MEITKRDLLVLLTTSLVVPETTNAQPYNLLDGDKRGLVTPSGIVHANRGFSSGFSSGFGS